MARSSPKPFVFVLMPFANEFTDIYELGIKAACVEAGAYCERVDEQIFEGSMLERIYNQISKADILISDMTGKNPNVFYETGYAHALGKRVILLTQKSEDIPFDLKHYSHIVYGGGIVKLKNELVNRISYYLENPQSPATGEHELKFKVNDIDLESSEVVYSKQYPVGFHSGAKLKIDVFNPLSVPYTAESSLALITPTFFAYSGYEAEKEAVKIENGKNLHTISSMDPLFPKGYTSFNFMVGFLESQSNYLGFEEGCECTLRHFTNLGYKDYPFILKKK